MTVRVGVGVVVGEMWLVGVRRSEVIMMCGMW